MDLQENGTTQQRPDELDWRHVWLTTAMIDSGKLIPGDIPRYRVRKRRPTLAMRMQKLRRLRAVLDGQA